MVSGMWFAHIGAFLRIFLRQIWFRKFPVNQQFEKKNSSQFFFFKFHFGTVETINLDYFKLFKNDYTLITLNSK